MPKKFFTPKDANQRLPLIKKIVCDILDKGKLLRDFVSKAGGDDLPAHLVSIQEDIEQLIDELEALGCYYKDWNFEIGLVDFPATINNEEALLCWRSDEPDVRWYHSYHDGYPGRKPIPEELLSDISQASAPSSSTRS